jgi:hypothetical protein
VGSRGSVVSIATGRQRGRSSSPSRVKILILSMLPRPVLGPTQPSVQWVLEAFSPGVERPEREAYHSHPTSAEVKSTWIHTSTPPYALMA